MTELEMIEKLFDNLYARPWGRKVAFYTTIDSDGNVVRKEIKNTPVAKSEVKKEVKDEKPVEVKEEIANEVKVETPTEETAETKQRNKGVLLKETVLKTLANPEVRAELKAIIKEAINELN